MRDLTTPVTETKTAQQYVSQGKYQILLDINGDVDLSKSYYQYLVTNLPEGGYTPYLIYADQMPVAFRSKLKEIHQMVVSYADAQGQLLPGTDTDDL